MLMSRRILLCAAFLGFAAPVFAAEAPSGELHFNRDVRPILSDNCFRCHGPDKGNRKAKLRLDDRDVAIEKGAIVPGKPDESELIRRINSTDPDEVMPPSDTHQKLSQKNKDILRRWIASGAQYEPHWAYIAPTRHAIPVVKNKNWVANPIDNFILHSLEQKKIEPSQSAAKEKLLRRLSLDLIGLPPTPEEVRAFVNDKSPKAYERQVDRLLSSPHFGERMAAPWLDADRFADTVGYHGDQNQNCFPYRDYVIDSFNRNKPFDQFTVEQIAGDLLPNPTPEQLTATCFNRLNMMTREGGAQPKEYVAKYQADRARTISSAWLGSTMGCAECHDHKYDPFSTKDFYSLEAFFADVKQWGVYADYGYTPNPDLKGYGNDHPFAPEIEVQSPALERRRTNLLAQVAMTAHAALVDKSVKKNFEQWQRESADFLKKHPTGWVTVKPEVTLKFKETNVVASTNFAVADDGVVTLSDKPHENLQLSLKLSPGTLSAIRLQVLSQEDAMTGKGRRQRKGTMLVLSGTIKTNGGEAKLNFFHAEADHKEPKYTMGIANVGVKDGWQISPDAEVSTAVWVLEQPVHLTNDATVVLNLGNAALIRVSAAISPFAAIEPLEVGSDAMNAAFLKKPSRRTATERDLLDSAFLLSAAPARPETAAIKKLAPEIWNCRNGRTTVMVTQTREPLVTRVLPRGNWQDDSGEIVQPNVPHFLPQPATAEGRRLTRLDLAQWLVSTNNPLTARTIVNRTWKQFFGIGLSAVVDDLGAQGEWPVHPELLDWLAVEYRESGWDTKHLVKLMVMSSTYRQDSNQRPQLREVDPNNRLLSCQSPRRLDAEFVRDNALAISGLLNLEMGGPSAHPYQPAGFYSNIQFPERDYYPEMDNRQYRRGVYTWWQRTFLHPMMSNFDAPSREETVCARNLSNTPQQGLTLLNDPTFVEAARVFAESVIGPKKETDDQRILTIYQRALARQPKASEQQSLKTFLEEQRKHYQMNTEEADKLSRVGLKTAVSSLDKVELAAWTQVCRVVLNLHETITRY
jgi:hypothetical protein